MFKVQGPLRVSTLNVEPVAVGTALAGGPPHGSGRAELPHPALALGNNAKAHQRMRMITPLTLSPAGCLTYPLRRAGHVFPALCPGHVTLKRLPLGQSPFLHCLRSRTGGFVRQLRKYYETVRLPVPVHHRRASLDFPMRPPSGGSHGISRFPLKVLTYMLRVSDRAGSKSVSRYRRLQFCLPLSSTTSAPRSGHRLRDGVQFRGSIPGLHAPLSTLHPRPYARRYMTRGQCGSLLLHRMKLSFTTPCRLLPAHLNFEPGTGQQQHEHLRHPGRRPPVNEPTAEGSLEPLGIVSIRARLGHSARRLQRRRRCMVLLPPRPRPFRAPIVGTKMA